MRLRSVLTAAALGAVAATALSSCSSSGSGGSSIASPAGASSAPTGNPIPIGVVGSYSGPVSSSIAAAHDSIIAWAAAVNASGGINGRPVKLYVKDDGGNLSTSLTAVKSLVADDHVVALVGEAAGSAAPWAQYVESAGIPVIGGNSVDITFLSNADFYGVGGNLLSDYYGIAALAKQNGDKIGNVFCAELPACAATTQLLTAFGGPLGVTVAYSSKAAASTPDFTAVCQGLKSANVQSYTLGLAAATFKQVARQCGQQQLTAKLLTSYVTDSTYPGTGAFEGMEVADPVFPYWLDTTAATKEFHAAIARYSPTLGTDANPLNAEAAQAWASGKLFEAAVKASGSSDITSASLKKGLYALKGAAQLLLQLHGGQGRLPIGERRQADVRTGRDHRRRCGEAGLRS
jgi:branched-chain amino acid transport system substrate-binding protein